MSRTCTAEELSFERGLYDTRTHGLRHNEATAAGCAPWRFLWHSVDGSVEAWVAPRNNAACNGTWERVTTIPPGTPLEIVEQTLRAMAMLGMDTGV